MTLSRMDVPVTVNVPDIALAGTYPLAQLSVEMRVCLNPTDDYAAVLEYATHKGPNFVELLDGELQAEVDARVRRALRPSTSEVLYRDRDLISPEAIGTAPLLGGLFAVSRVVFGEPEWHPGFLADLEVRIEAEQERTRIGAELENAGLQQVLDETRDVLGARKAMRRGLTLAQFENPESLEREKDRQHEIEKALIEQLDALRRVGGSAVESALMALRGRDVPAPPDLARLAPGVIEGEARTEEHPTDDGALHARVAEALDLQRLRRDRGLRRIWRSEALPGEPLGLGLGDGPRGLTVVLVCRDVLPNAELSRVAEVFIEHASAAQVVALDGVRTAEELVLDYLQALVPELDGALASVDLDIDEERLTVRLRGTGKRMSPIAKRINDPDGLFLVPLQRILPYDVIDVEAAEPA